MGPPAGAHRVGWPVSDLAHQIAEELDRGLVMPVYALLGHDLGEMLRQRVRESAPRLAAQLCGDTDHEIAGTAQDLVIALWPHEDPDPEWWRTPLGRRVAASYGIHDSEAVTISVASAMLGVHRSRVYQLIESGKLDHHPDGGVTRSSVMARLAGA